MIATIAIYAQIPNNGLVAWFPFSGDFQDKSESGIVLDTSAAGSPVLTSDRNGDANAAYSFDGNTTAFKSTTSNLPTGNSDITISAWIYALNGGVPRVITKWGSYELGQNKEIVFYHTSIEGLLYLGLTNGADSIVVRAPNNASARWFHVAVVAIS